MSAEATSDRVLLPRCGGEACRPGLGSPQHADDCPIFGVVGFVTMQRLGDGACIGCAVLHAESACPELGEAGA